MKRSEDETTVSVVTNAIGVAIHARDGRWISVDPETGEKSIQLSDREVALCREAAIRALDHLDAYEKENPR